jgi:hypothetical protein
MLEHGLAEPDIEAEQQDVAGHHLGEDLAQGEETGGVHEPADAGDQIEARNMGDVRSPLPPDERQDRPYEERPAAIAGQLAGRRAHRGALPAARSQAMTKGISDPAARMTSICGGMIPPTRKIR